MTLAMAFDPITLTVGAPAVSYVLTSANVVVAVASLKTLVLAAEAILLAEANRIERARAALTSTYGGRRRRDAISTNQIETSNMNPIFNAIAAVDSSDCAKLLVCHVIAKPESDLSSYEMMIVNLFNSFNKFQVDNAAATGAQAQYILAAQTGAFKKPEVCVTHYKKCPYAVKQLSQLLKQ